MVLNDDDGDADADVDTDANGDADADVHNDYESDVMSHHRLGHTTRLKPSLEHKPCHYA